jgi:hypothetical protein
MAQKIIDNTKARKHSTKRQRVQVAGWVLPPQKARIREIAKEQGLSESKVVAGLIDKALQIDADLHYGAMLKPVIEKIIDKKMRSIVNHQATLLVRNAFDAGQVRGIVTNILGRMPGVTPEILNEILDDSARFAKNRIVSRTPQLEGLITELEKQLREQDPEKDK